MEKVNKVPSRIIELELEIKLLEYLKTNKTIDDGMYDYCVNRILNEITLKNKIDNDINNYKLVT